MRLSFNRGLDKYFGLLEIGIDSGIIKKEGRSVVFPNGLKIHPNNIAAAPERFFTKETLDLLDAEIQKRFCYNKEDMAIVHGEEEEEDAVDINPMDILAALPSVVQPEVVVAPVTDDPYDYEDPTDDGDSTEDSTDIDPETDEELSEENMDEPVDLDAPAEYEE
jgi:hypothetical protein